MSTSPLAFQIKNDKLQNMKITVLAENTLSEKISQPLKEKLKTEHGLSLFIETENHKILFDMGQTNIFIENAKHLELDLENVDFAILSHGHYDHGGLHSSENQLFGVSGFLLLNKSAPIFLQETAFSENYNASKKYIGLDKSLLENPDFQKRKVFIQDEKVITENLKLISCNNFEKIAPTNTDGLTQLKDGIFVPEDFSHEHYLLIEENHKKILISGCSHKGILNITEWFKPDILIGGFHLKSFDVENPADKEKLISLGEKLASYNSTFYTCHCTGLPQFDLLKSVMNEKLFYLATGDKVIL